MYRSRLLKGCIALFALAVPAGAASAGGTEPDDTSSETTEPAGSAAEESGPPSASAPDDTTGNDSGGGQPPEDMEFQVDMMLGLVPEDEMEDYWAQQNQESERAIQQCMNDAGFEYEPMGAEDISFDQYNGLSQLEYAQQFGFGMWTTMDPENQQTGPMNEWPNQSIVDELPPEEQNAWFEVNNRCSQDAYSATNDPWSNPMVQQIMEDFGQDVENDPRVRDALAAWQDCMADSGHPFANEGEMYEQVYGGDNQEIWDLQSEFFESEAWLETSPDHARWQALVDDEIEIAVADATCTPALVEVRQEVTRDLRDELVAVWQTIDWSLPPVTYEEVMFPDETIVEEPSGSDVDTTGPGEPADTGDESTETTETPVGLDLGAAPETTEAP
jgi:hypothetical protein